MFQTNITSKNLCLLLGRVLYPLITGSANSWRVNWWTAKLYRCITRTVHDSFEDWISQNKSQNNVDQSLSSTHSDRWPTWIPRGCRAHKSVSISVAFLVFQDIQANKKCLRVYRRICSAKRHMTAAITSLHILQICSVRMNYRCEVANRKQLWWSRQSHNLFSAFSRRNTLVAVNLFISTQKCSGTSKCWSRCCGACLFFVRMSLVGKKKLLDKGTWRDIFRAE